MMIDRFVVFWPTSTIKDEKFINGRSNMQSGTGFPRCHQLKSYVRYYHSGWNLGVLSRLGLHLAVFSLVFSRVLPSLVVFSRV